MRFGRIFYVIVLLFCIFETARLWNIAPTQMAAHFNVQGDPDRFVAKPEFFWFQVQTMLVVVGVSLLLQILSLFIPVNLINMPNREYWLAPERREETLDRINSFGPAMFGVVLLVIQAGFEVSVQTNLQMPIHFNAQLMTSVMIVSLVVIGVMLAWLVMSFRVPASNS
jgi:uncharacterized membrane protein